MPKSSDSEYRILRVLLRHGELTSAQIAEIIGMRVESARRLLNDMEKRGRVARVDVRRPTRFRRID